MRIKKTSQYMAKDRATLSNVHGTSDENGYTQEYINGLTNVTTTSYANEYENTRVYTFPGFQIITINKYVNLATTDSDGRYAFTPGDWPVPFSSQPTVTFSAVKNTLSQWQQYAFNAYDVTPTSAGSYVIARPSTGVQSNVNFYVNIIAIGPVNN